MSEQRWSKLEGFTDNVRNAPYSEKIDSNISKISVLNSRPVIAATTAAIVGLILLTAQPPFVCHREYGSLDEDDYIERLSFRRLLGWMVIVFMITLLAVDIVKLTNAF